jgi:sugar O-acyltransferase (sialic acid O-acetyltransferase NeuD family)
MPVEDSPPSTTPRPAEEGGHDHEDGATIIERRSTLEMFGGKGGADGDGAPAKAAVPEALTQSQTEPDSDRDSGSIDPDQERRPVIVVGTGPMALSVAEVLEFLRDYDVVGLVDDDPDPATGPRRGLPVLGKFDDLPEVARRWRRLYGIPGFEDNTLRRHHYHRLVRARVRPASAIHPRSSISTRAITGPGFVAMSGVVVSPAAVLGENVALGANVFVGFDARLGDHAQVFPGAVLMERVKVGAAVSIGPNAVLNPGVTVGEGTIVGAGSVVTRDLPDDVVAYGNPARVVRKREHHE